MMPPANTKTGYQTYDAFGKKGELKASLIYLLTNIVINSRNNGRAITNFTDLPYLLGWGAQIENLDSIVSVMLSDDQEYVKKRNWLVTKIKEAYLRKRAQAEGRWELKELYNKWFRLLCNKLTSFEVYPEMTEEGYDSQA